MKRKYKYNIGDVIKAKIGDVIIEGFGINDKGESIYHCSCNNGHKFDRFGYAMNSCPICSGNKIVRGINDISTINPELFKQMVDKNFGYTHAQYSHKKTDWKCPNCGNVIKDKSPSTILLYGYGCRKCSDGASYSEKFISNLLSDLDISFISEYSRKDAEWCGKYRYDFYLIDYDTILEVHGNQHYEDTQWGKCTDIQKNDDDKKELALSHVSDYIVIDARESSKKYLKQSILRNDNFYNKILSGLWIRKVMFLKWNDISKRASSSYVKIASEMYNNGSLTFEIADSLNVCKDSVRNYLILGAECGLCNYNADDMRERGLKFIVNHNRRNTQPITCNENSFAFESIIKCERVSNDIFGVHIDHSNISAVLKGKRNHTKNYTFSYISKEQFNKIKTESPNKAFGDFFILD